MKLATLRGPGRDGRLAVVAPDLRTAAFAPDIAPTLIDALEHWDDAEPGLRALALRLCTGRASAAFKFDPLDALAPLPRTYQWLDGSAFAAHGDLMSKVFGIQNPQTERPLMYQGMSHQFLSASDDVPFRSESDGIDFEGEFGVITDAVPMGTSPEGAAGRIKLIVQINDWSLRTLAPVEMKAGFGWVQAKPACSAAPLAITIDELGAGWRDGRVALPLQVWLNGRLFGAANGAEMGFGFGELVAHAAATRSLCPGTIIGSGTVSNASYRQIGSSCIAERRAIETLDEGAPRTPYMSFGDSVRMEAVGLDGGSPFGAIDQRVISVEHGSDSG
jgi:fumarylacetoacetate (FAA) hydrolase